MANRKMTFAKTKLARSISISRASTAKQLGVAAALLLGAGNVNALGLGTLEIDSNLDQPLNGSIELQVASGDDIDSVTAVIASREDFESLGIDYPDYMTDISLSVDKSGADTSLRVSSQNVVIKEPFIHFLVRVEWSGGSFLREYTALIDPPVYAAEAPPSIAQPREVGTDQSYQAGTADAPEVTEETYDEVVTDNEVSDQVEDIVDEPLVEDGFYNDDTEDDDQEAGIADAASDGDVAETVSDFSDEPTDARYGPVASGESLSMIAQELQSQFPDLSIYSIMQVLFEENKSAFIKGNINGLIKGSILNIGDLNAIRAVDARDAKDFFRTQVAEWDPSVLIASSSDDSINVGQDEYNFDSDSFSSDADTAVAEEQDSFQVGASSEADDFVSSDQGDNRDGEVLALRQEISQLQTSLASSELENQELSERISLLEGQLSDMNRLVEMNVENAELANLESSLAEQNALEEAADVVDEVVEDSSAIDEFLNSADETVGDAVEEVSEEGSSAIDEFIAEGDEALASGDEAVTDIVDESSGAIDEFLSDTGETIDDGIDSTQEGIDSVIEDASEESVAVEEPTPAPVVTTPKVAEKSFMDKAISAFTDGGLWKVLAGLGALLAAGVGLIFFRRRKADEEFEISMLSIESNSHTVNDDTQDSASMSMSHTASVADEAINPDKETSFLTVYSDSDAVVQADEVDPVAEADVYIAYGRDEQAEEVLLDGVASHPDRVDIKQKLLNLYYKRQNSEGFERIAEELYSQRAALTGDVWQEVSQMGKEIAPNNPLFGLSGDDLSTAIEADSELQLSGEDVAEVPIEGPADDVAVEDKADDDAGDLEFEPSKPAGEDKAAAELVSVDDASELVVESLSNDESIQLINFDDGRSEISELDEVEIDALDLDGDSVTKADEGDVLELTVDNINDDLKELDGAASDDSGERTLSEVQEVSDLEIDADYDEARTQYELAKVFVDLGDEDGARKILVELVKDEQNSASVLEDARSLLDSIS